MSLNALKQNWLQTVEAVAVQFVTLVNLKDQLIVVLLLVCCQASLKDGMFHHHLLEKFMPLVASYLDITAVNMEKEMVQAVADENWKQEQ